MAACDAYIRSRLPHISGRGEVIDLALVGPPWGYTDEHYGRTDNRFFRLIGVRFNPGGREVKSWSQPILQALPANVPDFVALIAHRRPDGTREFLLHIAAEPGNEGILLFPNDSAERDRLLAENRGELITVNGHEAIRSSVLARPSVQTSQGNVDSHNLRVPLIGLVREMLDHGLFQMRAQPQDGGRHFRKTVHEHWVWVDDAWRARVDEAILAGPPENAKNAWSPEDFLWVTEEVFNHLEDRAAANAFLVSLVGRAIRRG